MEQHHYNWLSRIVESCNDEFHIQGAHNLLYHFGQKYGKENLYQRLWLEIEKREKDIQNPLHRDEERQPPSIEKDWRKPFDNRKGNA